MPGRLIRTRQGIFVRLDLLADIDADDVGALLSHPNRMCSPLASRRTRNECDFAFKTIVHRTSFLSMQDRPTVLAHT